MSINEKIKGLIEKDDVCLFMKGTPDVPQVLKLTVIGQQYRNYMLKANSLEEVI